ncbi:type I glyceraldehyde-3-phosphate dehydrogenase [bacterium SCSIO 12741]|nr:type I glyceraldehyde-3-phosphate dehydrogenase [bacterium SCSIO 12741]
MGTTRIAINGFGRIGRNFLRELFRRNAQQEIEVVAINDLAPSETLAHLLKYDSVHRSFPESLEVQEDQLIIQGKAIKILNEKSPANLPWKELEVDLVLESTGLFRTRELASQHLRAGAKQVLLSAPAQDRDIPSVVLGVNESILTGKEDVISNASCTTNNIAPLFKILEDEFGIESAYVTTVHSFTSDQRLHDAPHKDLRRARAATQSIVPTTTGAAKAITRILPQLEGKVGGCGIRVPVPNGSLSDISFIVKKNTTVEELNACIKRYADGPMKGVLKYETDPIVSVDILGNPYSCVYDSLLTSVIGRMVKLVGWYDNEIGYSNRLIDLLLKLRAMS